VSKKVSTNANSTKDYRGVDRLRRVALATTQVFAALDPIPLEERIEVLESILSLIDPEPEDEPEPR
jgi:hypothetical protein